MLGDSLLIVDVDGCVDAIVDGRTADLTDYAVEGVRAARNQPDGFYVASTPARHRVPAVRGSPPPQAAARRGSARTRRAPSNASPSPTRNSSLTAWPPRVPWSCRARLVELKETEGEG